MPFEDVLVHEATPLRTTQPDAEAEVPGTWVDGEWVTAPGLGGGLPTETDEGTPFDCCLFLPKGEEGAGTAGSVVVLGGKTVRRPTLLYAPEDRLGGIVALSAEDEVSIVAPELNRARGMAEDEEEVWQVDGDPQPFGPPGEDVVGFQATLKRVVD